jgi:nitrate reductase NapAB chaperone NapD
MHYSGILVVVDPLEVKSSMDELSRLPGVEVHYCDPESGRIIVVQETETVLAQEEGLRSIQALPRVKMAALVEHRIDSEATEVEAET